MNTESLKVHCVERVDDIPVLWATLERLRLAQILDRHFPSGHRWKGELTFGEVACVWLTFIASQGDHRLNQLQPWAQANRHTLQACLGKNVRPLDFQDDRLADLLDRLAQDQSWQACEADINQHIVRVYNLRTDLFRVDTTTANSYVATLAELGLFQFGHSKDRDDQPQIKIPMATLDPLGLPVTTCVVPGNCADDPLYVPEYQKVQRAFGTGGKTYVTDCKGAALTARAYLQSTGDYYLCPLPESQLSAATRRELLQPVWQGQQPLQRVYRPEAAGQAEELVAEGFCYDVPLQAEVTGRPVQWTERRWLVRSLAFAAGQQQQLDRRLQKATEQLSQLTQRKQGKKRLTTQEVTAAAEAIVTKQRVEGLLHWEVKTISHRRSIRGYGERPARRVQEQEQQVVVSRCEEAIRQAKQQMGWRVYAENHLELNLAAVVWGYRGQHRLEDNWSRLKGQPLGLTPLYLQYESRILGLVLLLSLALRLLSVLEWTVRQKLQERGQKLKGLYPGQPGRQTHSPSAELLLAAFKGISLALIEVAEQQVAQVTALNEVQQQVLELWGLSPDLYHRLALHFPEPPSG
jgi:transposase